MPGWRGSGQAGALAGKGLWPGRGLAASPRSVAEPYLNRSMRTSLPYQRHKDLPALPEVMDVWVPQFTSWPWFWSSLPYQRHENVPALTNAQECWRCILLGVVRAGVLKCGYPWPAGLEVPGGAVCFLTIFQGSMVAL